MIKRYDLFYKETQKILLLHFSTIIKTVTEIILCIKKYLTTLNKTSY
jgi:hypothetical protein